MCIATGRTRNTNVEVTALAFRQLPVHRLAQDMKQEFLRFLDPGGVGAGSHDVQGRGALGKTSVTAQKADALQPSTFGFFQGAQDIA